MHSLPSSTKPGCLSGADPWRLRLCTLEAILRLCLARLLIAMVPLGRWRRWLGGNSLETAELSAARRLASHVERAAMRLPFATKCLPRAMALSWMLRRRQIGHTIVFAARPPGQRGGEDGLHAWIECNGIVVIGDLPGPWLRVLELGASKSGAGQKTE